MKIPTYQAGATALGLVTSKQAAAQGRCVTGRPVAKLHDGTNLYDLSATHQRRLRCTCRRNKK